MMKCKSYSDYICKYYWNGSCHYSEKVFGGPLASCYYVNDFENCICFESPIEYKKESKNMMKCKYYSDYESGQHDSGVCHYDEYKCGGFPMICTHKDNEENCACFEPVKCELNSIGAEIGKLETDQEKLMNPRTLIIQNCDKIILKPKSLEVEVKIEKDNFDDFDFIIINEHKFKRV